MGRLIIRSFFEDIKNFKNMIPYRTKKIAGTVAKYLPENYGVNELSEFLHPNQQKVILSSVIEIDSNIKIITLSPCGNATLARFRAGQGVNIKIGKETTFFSLVSAPDEKDYKVVVYADSSDAVSEYLFKAVLNTEIEVSGPTGLFYFSSLRDGENIFIICDIYGFAAAISMCRQIVDIPNKSVKIFFVDKDKNLNTLNWLKVLSGNIDISYVKNEKEVYEAVSAQTDFSVSFFVSGKESFCSSIKTCFDNNEFIMGRIRVNVFNPSVKQDFLPEKYSCQVFYRNKTFKFDCYANETVLSAFERNCVPSPAKCKIGECGYCRCKLIEGEVEYVTCNDIDSRRSADKKYGFIHPCRAFPKTDIMIKL